MPQITHKILSGSPSAVPHRAAVDYISAVKFAYQFRRFFCNLFNIACVASLASAEVETDVAAVAEYGNHVVVAESRRNGYREVNE